MTYVVFINRPIGPTRLACWLTDGDAFPVIRHAGRADSGPDSLTHLWHQLTRQESRIMINYNRPKKRNALQIFTQNWQFLSWNCAYFGDDHGRDTESRQLSKITAQGENHGNHGDREFVIYIHPYPWLIQQLVLPYKPWFTYPERHAQTSQSGPCRKYVIPTDNIMVLNWCFNWTKKYNLLGSLYTIEYIFW